MVACVLEATGYVRTYEAGSSADADFDAGAGRESERGGHAQQLTNKQDSWEDMVSSSVHAPTV